MRWLLVTFELNVPLVTWVGRRHRIRLGDPQWRPLKRDELERMIGCSYPDPLGIMTRTSQL